MIDDLIFFGIDHNIPEEMGISFLFRMFMAYGRNIQRFVGPLKDINDSRSTERRFTGPKTIPAHLRRKRE